MSSIQSHPSFFLALPRSPNLNHLKEEAKSLKNRLAADDQSAKSFVEFHLQASGVIKPVIKLADVQFALARAYGFKSWPRLKAFIESHALTPKERGDLFLRSLFTDQYSLLEELYAQSNKLPKSDIFVSAALGDSDAVEAMLARDSTLAVSSGGPMHTQALTYAAYARFFLWDVTFADRQQKIVRLLLAHGADPNSFVYEEKRGKEDGRLSALYGCCRFPGNPNIARLLLDAGATTDDGESLYHAAELDDARCLELLFAAGVPKESQEFCIRRALDGDRPRALEVFLKYGTNPNHLDWALFRNQSLEVIRLLVEAGANVNAESEDHWLLGRIKHLKPIQIAERNGSEDIVAYLLSVGAEDARTAQDRLIGACAREDESGMRAIMASHPHLAESLSVADQSYLTAFARSGRLKTVKLMLDAGFDIETRADDLDATPVLYAATTGDVPMLRLLIARGARLDVKHKYGGTPLSTCIYCAAHHRTPRGDYAEAVRYLIEAGEEPKDELLKLAAEGDLDDIVDVLKMHGASL